MLTMGWPLGWPLLPMQGMSTARVMQQFVHGAYDNLRATCAVVGPREHPANVQGGSSTCHVDVARRRARALHDLLLQYQLIAHVSSLALFTVELIMRLLKFEGFFGWPSVVGHTAFFPAKWPHCLQCCLGTRSGAATKPEGCPNVKVSLDGHLDRVARHHSLPSGLVVEICYIRHSNGSRAAEVAQIR